MSEFDKYIEILAPGGNIDQVKVAIREGAHSVYVGPRQMSGRSGYAEMNMENVKLARELTANSGVKLYVAVNRSIPIGDEDKWRKLLFEIANLEPDALIVGSFCVFNLLKELGICVPFHASTFLGIYNPSAAQLIRSLKFSRIIMNTSLRIDEMRAITRSVPDMEYELIAYGGICLNDNHRCNLPHGLRPIERPLEESCKDYTCLGSRESTYCQLRLKVMDEEGNVVNRGRLMCNPVIDLSPNLLPFIRMGIRHFKIAGRERSKEFVSMAIRSLKDGIKKAMEMNESPLEYFPYI